MVVWATYYRKRGSASYIVREVLSVRERERDTERERERERDGSDVTIFARLAMNSHFHLPKIRTIGDELTLSLAKNSHFLFLPSHFPSLPSRRGHHCGAEIRNEFTLSIAKNCFAVVVVACLRGVFFVSSLIAPCSSWPFSLRKQFFYASRGFCPTGGKQRCGCSQMRQAGTSCTFDGFRYDGDQRESWFRLVESEGYEWRWIFAGRGN